jgi:uncharacterized protein (TIGR03435 family)
VPLCIVVTMAVLCCPSRPMQAGAQDDFDVVSVRLNRGDGDGGIVPRPGRFVAINTPLSDVVRYVFNVPTYRIVGIEKLGRDRYDITATFTGTKTGAEVTRMVQRLLASRFSLRTHTEVKRARAYLLERAKKDGTLGPQMKSVKSDCAPTDREGLTCMVMPRNGLYVAKGIEWSLGSLISSLASLLQSPVIDKTGLSGQYDINLSWQVLGSGSSDNEVGKPTLLRHSRTSWA